MKNKHLNAPWISRKYNYIYKITNLVNNKIYIGVHRTDNLDDGYMGSGTILKRSQTKYGIENFKKEILEFFDTYQEVLDREKEIVTIDFINEDTNYNIRTGGYGQCKWSEDGIKRLCDAATKRWENEEYKSKMMKYFKSDERRGNISKNVKKWIKENPEKHYERMLKINKNPDKINKMAEKHRGMKRSESARQNMALAQQKIFSDPETRRILSGRGKKYAHNPETGEIKRFDTIDDIPVGWFHGFPKQSEETKTKRGKTLQGSFFIHNNETKQIKRLLRGESVPDGWTLGRS